MNLKTTETNQEEEMLCDEEKMKVEFKGVLQTMKDNEEANMGNTVKYLEKLCQIQQECIKNGIYDGDLKESIEAVIKEKMDQYEESKKDFYKIHSLQVRVDSEIGIEVLEGLEPKHD